VRRFFILVFSFLALACGQQRSVRPPLVAGSFYPADPKELTAMVDGFLAQAKPAPVLNLIAIVSPHAGYPYSGPVAAWSYALLKGRKYDRVVVIAPDHMEGFSFVSVFDGEAYSTPLGRVPVDREFAKKLAGSNSLIKLSDRGHKAGGERSEHALEVQLPFLQRVLGEFQLVPVVMGTQSYEACRALGLALAQLIRDSNTLIVASSDLSHYHPYDEAVRLDRKTLNAIQEWDYLSMSRNFEHRIWEACGGGPIIAAMIAAERLGANQATVLRYANSGDTAGDKSRVVGYGAIAISKETRNTSTTGNFVLSPADRAELLRLARKSVETVVRDRKMYEPDASFSAALALERGAFVTLTEHGDLRGCIGYMSPMKPLAITVREVATLAAMRDYRFPPVSQGELADIDYEVSVLSPMHRVLDVNQIQPGRDGLLIKQGDTEGVLLPQVASENRWDRTTFLRQTCRKAGLAEECWREPATDIFSFTAVVFGDRKRPT
jgi:AmmeMemoRadiSam system protein B/AmmeMemoRadiSam system protein A